jgi:hypothetical protein
VADLREKIRVEEAESGEITVKLECTKENIYIGRIFKGPTTNGRKLIFLGFLLVGGHIDHQVKLQISVHDGLDFFRCNAKECALYTLNGNH